MSGSWRRFNSRTSSRAGPSASLAIWLAYRLWPWARRAVRPEAVSTTGLLILVGGFLLSAIIVRLELLVFVSGLSIYENILLFSAIFFLVNVSFLTLPMTSAVNA